MSVKDLYGLIDQVINWHRTRYPHVISNKPTKESYDAISQLCQHILVPLQEHYGALEVTYGFTAGELLNQIRKHAPSGIAPKLDQHAAHERTRNSTYYCDRLGAACDIVVPALKNEMGAVANWISKNLNYDRLYFYGKDRPIHISFGPDNKRFIQIMKTSTTGKRVPMRNCENLQFDDLWRE
jgi:hypothetical protein